MSREPWRPGSITDAIRGEDTRPRHHVHIEGLNHAADTFEGQYVDMWAVLIPLEHNRVQAVVWPLKRLPTRQGNDMDGRPGKLWATAARIDN